MSDSTEVAELILESAVAAQNTTSDAIKDIVDDRIQAAGEEEVAFIQAGVGLLVLLLVIWVAGSHIITARTKYLGEASVAALLGLFSGVVILVLQRFVWQAKLQRLLVFNTANFFTYLLPPIIFDAGLSCRKPLFFKSLPSIFCLGVLGTFTSFLVLGWGLRRLAPGSLALSDCLAMGAIFAATDSVATLQILSPTHTPQLYALVFGEGVLNDATSIVIMGVVKAASQSAADSGAGDPEVSGLAAFALVSGFVRSFMLSVLGGSVAGFAVSYVLRFLRSHLSPSDWGDCQQVALVGMASYLSYLCAGFLDMSGILTLFTCALVLSHYGLPFLASSAKATLMGAFRTMAYIAEGMIFIFLGMDMLDPVKWSAAQTFEVLWLCLLLMLLLAVSRAAFVLPVCGLHNLWSSTALELRDIIAIWWSGLVRGAVSIALVYYYFDPLGISASQHHSTLIVATLLIVLASTLGFGAATQPLLSRGLGIRIRGQGASEAGTSQPRPLSLDPSVEDFTATPRSWQSHGTASEGGVEMAPLTGGGLRAGVSTPPGPLDHFEAAVKGKWSHVKGQVSRAMSRLHPEVRPRGTPSGIKAARSPPPSTTGPATEATFLVAPAYLGSDADVEQYLREASERDRGSLPVSQRPTSLRGESHTQRGDGLGDTPRQAHLWEGSISDFEESDAGR